MTTYFGSIYPAVWSFQLALRSRGLGSVFTTMHLAFEEETRVLLGLPDDVAQVAMLPVAYTKGLDLQARLEGPRRSRSPISTSGATTTDRIRRPQAASPSRMW